MHWIDVLRSDRGRSRASGDEDVDSPFGGRRPRPLRLAVDVDTYPAQATEATEIFESIAEGEDTIQTLQISDDGPPNHHPGNDAPEGWIVTSVADVPERHGGGSVQWRLGAKKSFAIFHGEQLRAAYDWWRESIYEPRGADFAQRQVVKDVALGAGAKLAGCHLLVSHRKQLERGSVFNRLIDIPVCSVTDAVAIASLHLRLSGTFTPWRIPSAKSYTSRSTFYRTCAIALLPEWWRLLHNPPAGISYEKMTRLAFAVPSRLGKALRIRDEFLALLTHHPSGALSDLLGEEIEDVAIALMGAFDSVAEVTREVLEIGGRVIPAWQRSEFTERLRGLGGGAMLAWLDEGTRGRAAFDLVKELRNTVHGTAASTLPYQPDPGTFPPRIMFPLPNGLRVDQLVRSVRLLGGRVEDVNQAPEGLVVEPENMIDSLLAETCHALNGMLQHMPLGPPDCKPAEKPYGPVGDHRLTASTAEQLRLQLGLAASLFQPSGVPRSPVAL